MSKGISKGAFLSAVESLHGGHPKKVIVYQEYYLRGFDLLSILYSYTGEQLFKLYRQHLKSDFRPTYFSTGLANAFSDFIRDQDEYTHCFNKIGKLIKERKKLKMERRQRSNPLLS